jgi:hypothetical protein
MRREGDTSTPSEENAFSRDHLLEGETMGQKETEASAADGYDAALLSAPRSGSPPKTDRPNLSERIGANVSVYASVSVSESVSSLCVESLPVYT